MAGRPRSEGGVAGGRPAPLAAPPRSGAIPRLLLRQLQETHTQSQHRSFNQLLRGGRGQTQSVTGRASLPSAISPSR